MKNYILNFFKARHSDNKKPDAQIIDLAEYYNRKSILLFADSINLAQNGVYSVAQERYSLAKDFDRKYQELVE